jgi:DnaK suppressor protein
MANISIEHTAALKQMLDGERRRLVADTRDDLQRSGDPDYIQVAGSVNDFADESVADLLSELGTAFLDRHVHELREVEAALRRIAEGSYGECEQCGEYIGLERLMAFPAALRCVDCQELYERTRGLEASPSL